MKPVEAHWYKLPRPTVIGKFSLRNRRELGSRLYDRLQFDFIGSKDCINWQVLLPVSHVLWTTDDEEKTWQITNPKTLQLMKNCSYNCYGISVYEIEGQQMPGIQDFKMWELGKFMDQWNNSMIDHNVFLPLNYYRTKSRFQGHSIVSHLMYISFAFAFFFVILVMLPILE